jgi:hypothetical protein
MFPSWRDDKTDFLARDRRYLKPVEPVVKKAKKVKATSIKYPPSAGLFPLIISAIDEMGSLRAVLR